MAKELPKKYQIKIGLIGASPPIWRRLFIADSVPLSKLHEVIQVAMGWYNCHLHQFIVDRRYYGAPDPADDFGDSWEHKITLEKVLPFDPAETLPRCIKGKGACPPEDVGGIDTFRDFIAALNDPTHPAHNEYLEWVGGEYDPRSFDLDQINERLLRACR